MSTSRSRPSVLTHARRALAAGGEASIPRGSTLLVAVSGGPDSMALLDVVARLAAELDITVVAHGVDHGLRGAAAAELDGAEAFARLRGVPFARTKVDVGAGGNVQERARVARYAALATAAAMAGAVAVATAHHADDRAETVLLRMLRGAGARGLAVLPATAPWPFDGAPSLVVVRPLLRARRRDVVLHLERRRIPVAHDPSNHEVRFQRVRVRQELMPLLEALDPEIVTHLAQLADELKALRDGSAPRIPRATQEALGRLLADPEGALDASGSVWLPGGLVVTRAPSPSKNHPDRVAATRRGTGAHGPVGSTTRGEGKVLPWPSETSACAAGAPYCCDPAGTAVDRKVGTAVVTSSSSSSPRELGRIRSSLGGITRSSLKGPRSQ